MTVVFAVYAKLEKTLSISCWLAIKKISQISSLVVGCREMLLYPNYIL